MFLKYKLILVFPKKRQGPLKRTQHFGSYIGYQIKLRGFVVVVNKTSLK